MRAFANVKSSAITPRHPFVSNLIVGAMNQESIREPQRQPIAGLACGVILKLLCISYGPIEVVPPSHELGMLVVDDPGHVFSEVGIATEDRFCIPFYFAFEAFIGL